jgi:hypothetical protein
MNIMTELSEVWSAKCKTSPCTSDASVANPLPYFEEAFHYVEDVITQAYKSRNCTYAELLEEVQKVDPKIAARYFELFDAVDCDVYGKWCSGILTIEEYDLFCKMVDEWKEITSKMIKTIERMPE